MLKTVAEWETTKTAELTLARNIAAKAESEARSLTDEERTAVKTHVETARAAHKELLGLKGDAALIEEMNVLGRPVGELAAAGQDFGAKGRKTLGEKFTEAEIIKEWMKSVAPTGLISDGAKVQSPAMQFGRKDLITGVSGDSAGALVFPEWLGLQDGLGQFERPLRIADLITHGQTGSDTVEYARVTGITNNAATVAEATSDAAIDGETVTAVQGGLKPKSTLSLTKITTTVKTIAHWVPATKRALSDAGQIRTLIDAFLMYGLAEELEDQIVSGDNVGENFEGIFHVSGTSSQPFVAGSGNIDEDLLITCRKAKTVARVQGRVIPTAFVFNPADNERIDLTRDKQGRFYFGGPDTSQQQTLWGVPRIESEAIPEGTGVLADWKQAVLWDREMAAIQVSDSHADFFVRNLVAILAEMRAAFGIIRPKGFVMIELDGGS